MEHALPLIEEFARGGGGGSGGGSGGGGSGGDGGGGIFFLVGYLPMHFVGGLFRRTRKHPGIFIPLQITGWVIAMVYAAVLGSFVGFIGWMAGVCGLIGMAAGLYGWLGKAFRQSKATREALSRAAAGDAAWTEGAIIDHAKQTFLRYQRDWSHADTESMRHYMTPEYHYHNSLMMSALAFAERRNQMDDVMIRDATIVRVNDQQDDNKDEVVIGFSARAKDQLIDVRTNETLFVDSSIFREYWHFRRSGATWLLAGIEQQTANQWLRDRSLEAFAAQHGYYFSLDWGWLLLPRRGQLFKKGTFGKSDINNHIIGVYNNCLVQIYTYQMDPNVDSEVYLIAQTYIPKSYGNIVVRRRNALLNFGISGLQKISMEWQDFNKKYDVFATNAEQATSFELLHPVFMEKLAALPFEVTIEVVDNAVYLYSKQRKVAAENYAQMLAILQEAFKQMRL